MNGVSGLAMLRFFIRFVDLLCLPLDVILYFARRFAKFPDPLAQTLGEIGDLLRPEEDQDKQNDQEDLTGADITEHGSAPLSLRQVIDEFVNCETLYDRLKELLTICITEQRITRPLGMRHHTKNVAPAVGDPRDVS